MYTRNRRYSVFPDWLEVTWRWEESGFIPLAFVIVCKYCLVTPWVVRQEQTLNSQELLTLSNEMIFEWLMNTEGMFH